MEHGSDLQRSQTNFLIQKIKMKLMPAGETKKGKETRLNFFKKIDIRIVIFVCIKINNEDLELFFQRN